MNNEEFEKLKAMVRSILFSLGSTANERQLRSEYYNNEGRSLNDVLRKFNMTMFQFLSCISDVCTVKQIQGEIFITKVSNEKSNHLDDLTVINKNKVHIPRYVHSNYNSGYRNNFNQRNSQYNKYPIYQQYNSFNGHNPAMNTSINLVQCYNQQKQSQQQKQVEQFIIFQYEQLYSKYINLYNAYHSRIQQELTPPTCKPPNPPDDLKCSRISGEVDLNDYITSPMKIPKSRLKLADKTVPLTVKILSVVSPTDFVFQFSLNDLQNLTKDMLSHYSKFESCEELKISQLTPGMTLAVHFMQKWYRVEILCVNSREEAFVYFVDFDERRSVKIHQLRYLKKSFGSRSRMCSVGALFDVKPRGNDEDWSEDAVKIFTQITKDIEFYVKFECESFGKIELSLYLDIFKRSSVANMMVCKNSLMFSFKNHNKNSYILT